MCGDVLGTVMPVLQLAVVILAQKKEKDSFIRPLSVPFQEKNLTEESHRQVGSSKAANMNKLAKLRRHASWVPGYILQKYTLDKYTWEKYT